MELKIETTTRVAVELVVVFFCFKIPYLIVLIPLIDFAINILFLWVCTTLLKIIMTNEFESKSQEAQAPTMASTRLDPRRN